MKPAKTTAPIIVNASNSDKEVTLGKTMVVLHDSGLKSDPFQHAEALNEV